MSSNLKHLVLVFGCLLISSVSFAEDDVRVTQRLTIAGVNSGTVSLSYFNYDEELLTFFQAQGLQGGGYTWESLIKAGLGGEFPPAVESDPEGDAFYAYAATEEQLNSVRDLIYRLQSDRSFIEECIALAKSGGYLE